MLVKKNIEPILHKLFYDLCDVIELEEFKNDFGISDFKELIVLKNIPCRLCYDNVSSAVKGKASDYVTQTVTLLVGTDVFIKDGSFVRVYKNKGKTFVTYQKTGEAAVYDGHKEIKMILRDTFA